MVGYIMNPYRPWSGDTSSIATIMTEVLQAARIPSVHVIASPHVGRATSVSEFLAGGAHLIDLIGHYAEIDFAIVMDSLYEEVKHASPLPLVPIHLYLSYPWEAE